MAKERRIGRQKAVSDLKRGLILDAARKVFEADTAFQMINRHLNDIPVPPSQRTELPIPEALEESVLSCLAKNPAQRPQSVADLGRAMLAVETEAWTEDSARQWWTKHQPA